MEENLQELNDEKEKGKEVGKNELYKIANAITQQATTNATEFARGCSWNYICD